MEVLVTCVTGFLGGTIIHERLERGDSVRVYCRVTHPDLIENNLEIAQGDVGQYPRLLEAVDLNAFIIRIINIAGLPSQKRASHHAFCPSTITDSLLV